MTCILAGVFATMVWPSTLMNVCWYSCPTKDVIKRHLSFRVPYNMTCALTTVSKEV
jgi:hypothetical protein